MWRCSAGAGIRRSGVSDGEETIKILGMEKKVYEMKAPGQAWMLLLEACYCKVSGAERVGVSQRSGLYLRAMLSEEQYEEVRQMFEKEKRSVQQGLNAMKSRLILEAAERVRGGGR